MVLFVRQVAYNISGWLDKNKDPLNDNVVQLLSTSKDSLVSTFFTATKDGQSACVRDGGRERVTQREREGEWREREREKERGTDREKDRAVSPPWCDIPHLHSEK